MAVIASWRDKKWEISPQKIQAFNKLSTSFAVKTETKTTKDGKEEKIIKGLDLIPLSFDMKISDAIGIDVLKEIESWKDLVGKTGSFNLGGKRFLAEVYMLNSVSIDEIEVDGLGRTRSATISFSFVEAETKKVEVTSKAGPTSKEKRSKKIVNSQIISSTSIVTSV
jgi:hypothetical protein